MTAAISAVSLKGADASMFIGMTYTKQNQNENNIYP
jgi:hypothetical protein